MLQIKQMIKNRNKFVFFILISSILTPNIAQASPYEGLWTGRFSKSNGSRICPSQGVLEFLVKNSGNVRGSFNPGGGEITGNVSSNGRFNGVSDGSTNVKGQFVDDIGYGVYENSFYNCSGVIKVERSSPSLIKSDTKDEILNAIEKWVKP